MVQYQATPDYYNDYIAHYGKKGMKWHKHLKGKYYKTKSKAQEKLAKVNRAINFTDNKDITTNGGSRIYKQGYARWWTPRKTAYKINAEGSGKANYLSGQTGSKNVQTTKVRTGITKVENRPVARKKKIVSGTSTPRKRK